MPKAGDRVYTPEWVVRDMVEHFKPSGVILDPCKGDGVFLRFLPSDTLWCEIDEGIDFFHFNRHVDWVIGNPPYSLTRKWFNYSFKISENLLYLVPIRNIFSGYGFIKEIYNFGGIVEIRNYGTGGSLGFPMGNAIGAFHIQHGYNGQINFTFSTKKIELDFS